MNKLSCNKAQAMRMHVASISLTLLGIASLTAFAAVIPMHNESVRNDSSANISGSATQQKPHVNLQPNSQLDSQPAPGKWIRLCKEGQQCASADDDIKRRSTFKA